jgi:hypothetical protein
MASDDKKVKADPAPKKEAAAKDKSTAGEAVSKTEGGEAATTPSNYSRGEGQKPVSTAYKEKLERDFFEEKREEEKPIIGATGQEKGPRYIPGLRHFG